MAKDTAQGAHRFRRTRRDHATEITHDYVEMIAKIEAMHGECRGSDLARQFAVSHVTVTKTVARLKKDGWVQTVPYGPLTLTAKGKRLAKTVRARHETVLAFLKAIGVSEETAEADTEGIEHHVSPETLRCFRRFLKQNKLSN
ncbi:MAG: manganese-binding transcriptional regulator MntR [Pirellulaceae bacterium]|nr:manganese-binding transcriptional regulator MntR [Planctomycetales bacterium]